MKSKKQQVYYDPETTVIFTVKRRYKHRTIVGGCGTQFLTDARSSLIRHSIHNHVLGKCIPIDETSPLVHQDSELSSTYSLYRAYLDMSHLKHYRSLDKLCNQLVNLKGGDWKFNDDYSQEDFENDLDMLDRAAGHEVYPDHGFPTAMQEAIMCCEEPDKDSSDDICLCGDPDCNRSMAHIVEED